MVSLLCLLLLAGGALAQEEQTVVFKTPSGYSQLWVDESAVVTPEAIEATVEGIRQQDADPEQIVIFVHGFDVTRDHGTEKFSELARRAGAAMDTAGARAAFAGVQWDSEAGTLLGLEGAYFDKIPLARSVGRGPVRQLLSALHTAFPKARVSLWGHSMGCEVIAAAIAPEITYEQGAPFVEAFAPGAELKANALVFCGSDLDYDRLAKSGIPVRDKEPRVGLIWATVAPYSGKGDKAMNIRARVRGKGAGAAFLKMNLDQLNTAMTTRRIVFDGESIPHSHNFDEYYDDARLARIIPTMLYTADNSRAKPADLAEIDRILAAPDDVNSLLHHLDSDHYGTMYYTLWRVERLNCGDARHMCDGTLEHIGPLIKDSPQKIWRLQPRSECVTLKSGQFPTEKMMTRAGAPPWAKKK